MDSLYVIKYKTELGKVGILLLDFEVLLFPHLFKLNSIGGVTVVSTVVSQPDGPGPAVKGMHVRPNDNSKLTINPSLQT